MIRVAPLLAERDGEALALLEREPHLNVYLSYILERDALSRRSLVGASSGDTLIGLAYLGRQIVLAGERAGAEGIAAFAAAMPHPKAITAPTELVEVLWDRLPDWHRAARLIREHQPVMAVDATTLLVRNDASVSVRRATFADLKIVSENSAEMIAGELESDPRKHGREFTANIASMIDSELWWIGEYLGEEAFFCHIGAWSQHTAQMQGIWTVPHLRGKGIARAAFSAISAQLLEVVPSLSLYVNDFNNAAIALYHGIGYRDVGEFRTILF
ncbi:MAG: GNAT family N-acetyltransferase [Candidatus Eremiobacteraeota bacterium]|nr:GNAT family N-acetyltransferase [Candidatus Eremiobacteraeota bacterium]NNM91911.1 GNAT family N-acetyltransferase [Candidatus Eremiobacteraeota bacterium]